MGGMPMAAAVHARRRRRRADSSSSTRNETGPALTPGNTRLEPACAKRCSIAGRVPRTGHHLQQITMRLLTTLALGLALGLATVTTAFAQGTGRSLDIQPGARQNGMGATGVAIADDATGVTWWNPAGLGFVTKSAVDLTYAQLVPGLATDVNYNYATFVKPTAGWGAFGVGLVFLSYGTSEGTDPFGNPT